MIFNRYFTIKEKHSYDEIEWVKTTASIGKFKQENVEFPKFWSQNAIDIVAGKYFAGKLGTPERESSLKQTINRVVRTIVEWGLKDSYFGEEERRVYRFSDRTKEDWACAYYTILEDLGLDNALIFADEITYMLVNQIFSFNSPVWFNFGNPARKGQFQASACFIVSAEDTIESIAENAAIEMQIFKGGSGAGSNRSKLRSSRETIAGGGKSSGPCTFMKIYDEVAKATKSGGTTRRAAKMEILDIDHGDIETFIKQKGIEEVKAQALISAGFSGRYDEIGGAYDSVSFQSSNQSVRQTDAFRKVVENDEYWALLERNPTKDLSTYHELFHSRTTSQGRFHQLENKEHGRLDWFLVNNDHDDKVVERNGGYLKVIEWKFARALDLMIAEEAWKSGDPGVQFHDTINKWHTCKADGEIVASNPCSEYMFLDDTSCNLASLNLMKFYKNGDLTNAGAMFNTTAFVRAIEFILPAMDMIIDNASYPTDKIAKMTKKYRTLGLGYSNLGSLLMSWGLPYDSKDGREMAAAITALMTATAYRVSSNMADELGPFERWASNSKHVGEVLNLHQKAIQSSLDNSNYYPTAVHIMKIALIEIDAVTHVRNAQVTVLAPTGTISFSMDCDTTGIEPATMLKSFKQLVGGGELTLTITAVKKGLEALGYEPLVIPKILKYIEDTGDITGFVLLGEHFPVFATAIGKNSIPFMGHLEMMAAVQPFLSGAISKTINMPKSATVEDIQTVYSRAWELGLKSVAVYRDGCKSSQPINAKKENVARDVRDDGPISRIDWENISIKPKQPILLDKHLEEIVRNKSAQSISEKGFISIVSPNEYILNNGDTEGVQKKLEDFANKSGKKTPDNPAHKLTNGRPKPVRKKLSDDTEGPRHKYDIAGHEGYIHTGLYDDGELGEIFIKMNKTGSTINGLMDALGITLSVALQYGVPLTAFTEKFKNMKFEPYGITSNPKIRFTSSVIDYIAKYLEFHFLDEVVDDVDINTIKKSDLIFSIDSLEEVINDKDEITGEFCTVCGSVLHRTGTCLYCLQCKTSNGGCS